MSEGNDHSTANTMRERADESRVKLWLLLRANRLLITGALTVSVFILFVATVEVLQLPFPQQIESSDVIETLFSAMITVVVTGTTLVVTIGQLVLTQESGPFGDQRDRMSNSMEVRESIEELIDSPTPTDPSALLGEILEATVDLSGTLRESIARTHDDVLRKDVEEFTDSVIGNADTVCDQLDDAQFGSFDVVFASLDFNYGWKIFQVERIAHEYGENLTEYECDLLEEIKTALSLFAPAREHVKTLYFQWALIDLSRLILYAAVPAVIVSGLMFTGVDPKTFPGHTLGMDHITLIVGGAFAVTLLPFMLFVSYLLRILTVAKRTLAIEPLILRDSDR